MLKCFNHVSLFISPLCQNQAQQWHKKCHFDDGSYTQSYANSSPNKSSLNLYDADMAV